MHQAEGILQEMGIPITETELWTLIEPAVKAMNDATIDLDNLDTI